MWYLLLEHPTPSCNFLDYFFFFGRFFIFFFENFGSVALSVKLETLGVETPKGTPSALQPSQKLISQFFNMEMTETENDVDANAAAASVSISFSFHLIHDEKTK